MKNKLILLLTPVLLTAASINANIAENHDHLVDTSKYANVKYIDPDLVLWAETVYPGTEITAVFGDLKQPGQMYTIRLRLPANYIVPPHTHTQDEYMTVISGSLNVGIGDKVDKNSTVYLPIGGAVGIPGKVPHYAWTTEEMVMQIHAMGPRDTCFVYPPEKVLP
jgi:quercetin dioxygenase-like cupin family protein